jgi:hypothetical protein
VDFLTLYGIELDRELGSSQNTLFTVARRKAAINAGQLEFLRRTECVTRRSSVAIVDGTGEYDLDAVTDFGWLANAGVSIRIVNGSTTTYVEGDDLQQTTEERLNAEEPGWRAWTAGTPQFYYLRVDGGVRYLGFAPAPDITSPEVWTALVSYVPVPAALAADADVPFTFSSNPLRSLEMHHRALVHFAAYDLEKFRKDVQRSGVQYQLFEAEVAKYQSVQAPKGGQMVRMAVDYRRRGSFTRLQMDPRRWP